MRSCASSLIIVSSPFTREDTYLNTTIKREMVHFWINKTHKYAKWLLISIHTFLGSGRNFGYLFWVSGTLFKCQKQSDKIAETNARLKNKEILTLSFCVVVPICFCSS